MKHRTTSATLLLLVMVVLMVPGAILSVPLMAQAHHIVSDSGVAWVEPVSVLEVELEVGRFAPPKQPKGVWSELSLTAQMSMHESFSLLLRAPLALVSFDDGRMALGNGDVEFGGRVLLYATDHGSLILSTGINIEIPTGIALDGLGSGHVEASPYITASTNPTPKFVLFSQISSHHALTERADKKEPVRVHGAVLAPHTQDELSLRLGAAYVQQREHYISGALDTVLVYAKPSLGYISARATAGLFVLPNWRLALSADMHLVGPSRFVFKTKLGVAVFF